MPRRIAALLVALVGAATMVPLGAAPAGAAVEPGTDPLVITIESMSPAVLPRTGPIRISGTVTNLDDVTWTTINLYSFVSETPMTTAGELAAAADLPDEAAVVSRVADPEASETVEEIAPGDTASFSFSVPRALIPVSEPGVYWFGVQALGQGPEGRDSNADGRARTFLSLVDRTTAPLPTAVVVPLRRQLEYATDGSLDAVEGWIRALSPGGRLRSLVDFGASADSRAVTWLVDPALVDAVRQLAAGNPARSLAPTVVPEGEEPPAPEQDDEASASPSAPAETVGPEPDPTVTQTQALATEWLERLGRALPGHQVLGLPYGDIDVAGAADYSPRTYLSARNRTGAVLAPYDVPLDPAVSAPGGFLDAEGLDLVDPGDTVLLTDAMLTGTERDATGLEDSDVPAVVTDGSHRIVLTSQASTTGVGPGDAHSPLAVRQQVLAQAAVRTLSSDPQPLVLMPPPDWNPVMASGFFSGLDVSWLDLVSVDEAAATESATPVDPEQLSYPRAQDRSEIDRAGFAAAGELSRAGEQLQNLLAVNDRIARVLRDQALSSVSYSARSRPLTSRLDTDASTGWVQSKLRSVHIEAPRAFTMTGTEGRFSTTIVNDLEQPVTVGLSARATSGITVDQTEPVEVPAGGSARVLLTAVAPEGGIHNVTIGLTDAEGAPLGLSDELTIRSLAVSNVIWLFLGAAGVLLFGAIAFRLVRRVRAARRTPAQQPAGEAAPRPSPAPVRADRASVES